MPQQQQALITGGNCKKTYSTPMTDQNDNYVKILFRFYSNVLDEETVETMWAEIVDQEKGLYKIDNISFYASIASDDIVFAEYDEQEEGEAEPVHSKLEIGIRWCVVTLLNKVEIVGDLIISSSVGSWLKCRAMWAR